MSDLDFPSVIAVMRDKAAAENNLPASNENEEAMRAKVASGKLVEITGQGGIPVYARGSFQEGFTENSQLWKIELQDTNPCTLEALQHAELRVGGLAPTAMHSEMSHFSSPPYEIDGHWIQPFVFIGTMGEGVHLSVKFMDEPHFDRLMKVAIHEPTYDRMMNEMPADTTVQFIEVAFVLTSNQQLLDEWGIESGRLTRRRILEQTSRNEDVSN
jgi:hypothetical protein